MKHYYKAKELVKTANEKMIDCSYEINKHVINTAYYTLKHGIEEENFESYLNSVVEKTHKKLYNCGCQCSITTPLGNKIKEYEGGGDCYNWAVRAFKGAVKQYYEDLYLYNESEDENDGK